MNYRIEGKASKVVGMDVIIKDPFTEIPVFVEEFWKNGTHDRINEVAGRPVGSLLNGYHYDFGEDGSRRYLMGIELLKGKEALDILNTLQIPNHSYAVFDSWESIPDNGELGLEIINVWRRIYSEWFPSSNFEQS